MTTQIYNFSISGLTVLNMAMSFGATYNYLGHATAPTELLIFLIIIFSAAPVACGSSRARDQTCITAVTQAAVVTRPDP